MQQYRGMPLLLTGNPAAGDTTLISDYTISKVATLIDEYGTALDNTTNYQIPVNVLYSPGSTSIPTLTFYLYRDGKLEKVFGCRGTVSLQIDSGDIGRFSFTFRGIYGGESDAAMVSPSYQTTRPPVCGTQKC